MIVFEVKVHWEVVRDFSMMVSEDLKWEGHISTIVNKVNRLLGLQKRTFICRNPCLWRDLYASIVRPIESQG